MHSLSATLAVMGVALVLGALGFVSKQPAQIARYTHAAHSFEAPFHSAGGSAIRFWDYGGSTVVTTTFIRLTPDKPSRAGFVYNVDACVVHNWEVTVEFKIHGALKKSFGDGIGFFYIKDDLPKIGAGPVFGAPDRFTGLGVFLDTFDNNNDKRTPLVQVMIGDGATPYDRSDGFRTKAGECTAQYRSLAHPTRMRVTYDKGVLSVAMDLKGAGEFVDCVVLEDVDLPLGYHFALGSVTGDVHDTHDIYAFHLVALGGTNPLQDGAEPNRVPAVKDAHTDTAGAPKALGGGDGSSTFWVVLIVILVLALVAMIGYVLSLSWRTSRKRF